MARFARQFAICIATLLVGSWSPTDRIAGESAPGETPLAVRRNGNNSPAVVEVKTADRELQGIDYGRMSNLMLLMTRDGQLQRFDLGHGVKVRTVTESFEPAAGRELEADLRQEFGNKFKTLRTLHYVICHDSSDAFAQETAELVEQLYRAFTAYFGGRGMGFSKPQFPLVVLIFDSEPEFREYLAHAPGSAGMGRVSGIYSIETNRVAMFNASARDS